MAREKRQKVSDVGPLPSSLPRGTQFSPNRVVALSSDSVIGRSDPQRCLEKQKSSCSEQKETKETNNVNPGWDSDGDDEIVVNSDVQLLDDVDSDAGLYTLVKAIRVIQSQFLQTCPHFVPVSHLYVYMREENGTDETDVDIAVEELKKRHLVTCLYMPGVRDVALVETGDYIKAIHHLASNASNLLLKKACEWFEDVVKKYCGPIFPGSGDEQTGSGSKQYVFSQVPCLAPKSSCIGRTL